MKMLAYADYEEVSQAAAALLQRFLSQQPGALLCTATGNSPRRMYDLLAGRLMEDPCKIMGLDEWIGLPQQHPASAAHQLRRQLIDPLRISDHFLFDGAQPVETELDKAKEYLQRNGPIDLCVLGIGTNGHLGFNEPGEFLIPEIHMATLADSSRRHRMLAGSDLIPTHGITLGMRAVMQSRKIILLVSGRSKQAIMQQLMLRRITPLLPASLLWLHPDVTCIADEAAVRK